MAIGIDDLDFYEEEGLQTPPSGGEEPPKEPSTQEPLTQEPQTTPPPTGGEQTPPPANNGEEKDDIIKTLLKEKGIKDSTKIKFEGDNGTTEERDWKDLSREEQLNILRQSPTTTQKPDNDLSDEEIEFLNMLRTNNLTPRQYLNSLQQQTPEPSYTVDELSDDDLYVLDLQARVEGITEEQLAKSLENAKQDEALFKKQMEGIRKEYKDLEDQNNQQQAALEEQQREEQYQQFANVITEQINKIDSIAGLDVELEQDDKEQLAEFILGRDEAGISNLGKVLNDPESLVLMAWYALNGDKMIDDITTMYQNSIKKVRQEAYNKGLEDGKKGIQPGHVVVTPPPVEKPTKQQEKISTIEDLDF